MINDPIGGGRSLPPFWPRMRPAARLRSPPRCLNRRADRKRRGSRSRHGASCPRCLPAVLCPGRTVSGLAPRKILRFVLFGGRIPPFPGCQPPPNSRGVSPLQNKNFAQFGLLRFLVAGSPRCWLRPRCPQRSPSKLPPPLRCRAGPRSAGCLRSRASARCSSGCAAPALGLASDPAACAFFCFAFVPQLSRAGRRGGKPKQREGDARPGAGSAFPM